MFGFGKINTRADESAIRQFEREIADAVTRARIGHANLRAMARALQEHADALIRQEAMSYEPRRVHPANLPEVAP